MASRKCDRVHNYLELEQCANDDPQKVATDPDLCSEVHEKIKMIKEEKIIAITIRCHVGF